MRSLVRALILELAPNAEAYRDGSTNLVDELEYHSLALLEMAFALEDEFELEAIDEETARTITTVRHVEDHVVNALLAVVD
ncbi:MAG: acyl carrier protein [Actinobacteria bacterium]|nr:acyl carrier protein [Actinomycetota bacterium]